MRMIVYIDDILLMAETKEKARDQASGLIYLMQCLGFTINSEKTISEPSQRLEFLGYTVDITIMELSLPVLKIKKIRAESRQLLEAEHITARALSRLIGKMNATNPVIPPAPLFYRNLQMDFAVALRQGNQDYETNLVLSLDSREELRWWDTDGKVEWQDGASIGARTDHRIGRLKHGLGSLSPRHQHRGTLVPPGEGMAHQFPGIASGNSSPKNLRKEQEGDISATEDRQHNTSCLHQPPRGNGIQRTSSPDRDLWMWCLERNIHIQAQHLPGVLNQVADMESRSMRDRSNWKLDRRIFLKVNRRYGPLEVDLFASRLTNQCRRYFSWRPDPFAQATDAFLQDWRIMRGFANPPWNLVPRVLRKAQSLEADVILIAPPHTEDAAMVPSLVGNVSRLAMLTTQAGTQYQVSAHNAPTGHVEHLRERLSSQGLSGQAADLILKSWRTKTNKSYDSLFGRWNHWCSQRGSDPFSGPVSEVANFLASLYQDGYQYNSVNAYRSAISSVHEKVKGVPVGQHPIITRLVKGVFHE